MDSGSSNSRTSRPDHDGARQRDALLLTAGQFVDHAIAESLQSDLPQARLDALPDFSRAEALDTQAVRDVLEHRQMRKQRVVLENEADVALVGGNPRDVLVAESDTRPEVGRWKPAIMRKTRGLAAAGCAEQRQEFARPDIQIEVASPP